MWLPVLSINGQACVHMLYIRQGRFLAVAAITPRRLLAEQVSDLLDDFYLISI